MRCFRQILQNLGPRPQKGWSDPEGSAESAITVGVNIFKHLSVEQTDHHFVFTLTRPPAEGLAAAAEY